MVNKYLSLCELFLHFDRNVFFLWSIDNSIYIKYKLDVSYEPYILKIDEYNNIIAVLIESREFGQELVIFKLNKMKSSLKLKQKCPTIQRVYDIKITNQNTILLVNVVNLYEFNYQKMKFIKHISFVEPYFDQQVIRRYFSDSSEDFFSNSKMSTFYNSTDQYVNIVQRHYELQIRIFSINPYEKNENYYGFQSIKSNFFDVVKKDLFITNQLKDNTILMYSYNSKERNLYLLLRIPVMMMSTLKYISETSILLNISSHSRSFSVDLYSINHSDFKSIIQEEDLTSTNIQDYVREMQNYIKLQKIQRVANSKAQEATTDLVLVNDKMNYMIGTISSNNDKFHFTKLADIDSMIK